MKKIIIVVGGYGYQRNPEGPVDLITEKDGPIEVSDTEAERLVNLKVAKYAAEDEVTQKADIPVQEDTTEENEPTIAELRARAKELGLKANGSKEELIARIAEAEASQDTEDDEEPPVLAVAEPEV